MAKPVILLYLDSILLLPFFVVTKYLKDTEIPPVKIGTDKMLNPMRMVSSVNMY